MLDPAGLREDLRELLLRGGDRPQRRVENDRARRGRSLVNSENVRRHDVIQRS
jgi:hypothetical protein